MGGRTDVEAAASKPRHGAEGCRPGARTATGSVDRREDWKGLFDRHLHHRIDRILPPLSAPQRFRYKIEFRSTLVYCRAALEAEAALITSPCARAGNSTSETPTPTKLPSVIFFGGGRWSSGDRRRC